MVKYGHLDSACGFTLWLAFLVGFSACSTDEGGDEDDEATRGDGDGDTGDGDGDVGDGDGDAGTGGMGGGASFGPAPSELVFVASCNQTAHFQCIDYFGTSQSELAVKAHCDTVTGAVFSSERCSWAGVNGYCHVVSDEGKSEHVTYYYGAQEIADSNALICVAGGTWTDL